jgi:NhaP-type Na+/H+ or K+/H+ antiporter
VDPHLFYLCFGESALNDAVALVLFKTFAEFLQANVNGDGSIGRSCALFFVNITLGGVGSPALGLISAFLTAMILKRMDFRSHPSLELPLFLVLLLYVPFILAECLHFSGIVAIFFSGIFARRYIAPNLSQQTADSAETFFKLAAYLAETCIFLELGMSVFGLSGSFKWEFIGWAFIAALLGRALGIYPLALIYNWSLKELTGEGAADSPIALDGETDTDSVLSSTCSSMGSTEGNPSLGREKRKRHRTPHKRKDRHISPSMTHILWFAGLRGAVAYACVRDFPDTYGHNDEFIAATVVIVLVTIIVMGGATEHLLRYLEIEMDVDEDDYMENWHKKRKLKGAFHAFGKFRAL